MKVLCVMGEHQYGDPSRGIGIEYAAFVPTLRMLGHEVHHFESWNRASYRDFAALNRALLERVEALKPDVLLSVQRDYEIWTETLDAISSRGDVATVSWTTDDSWKYEQVSRYIGPHYHAMTTTYPEVVEKYQRDGINVLLTQWGVSPNVLQRPLSAAECRYKVTFVGAAHGDRKARADWLRARGVPLECFGYGWPNGSVRAEEIPMIMRDSVISLNFANSRGANQIKARTFEVPGSGGFLLTEQALGLEKFYEPGREVEAFKNDEELLEKIRHYLGKPAERDSIALAGFERTRLEHTYDFRLSQVLDFALKARDSWMAGKPAGRTVQSDPWQRHQMSAPLEALRGLTVGAARLAWGPKRGPRAARRLMFEASWRLAGSHTFSAGGWPGRMFPEQ